MTTDLIHLDQLGHDDVAIAGAKATNLGELMRIDGVRVPWGFCVTTDAFTKFVAATPLGDLVEGLSRMRRADRTGFAAASAEIRAVIEQSPLPVELVASIVASVDDGHDESGWAVRSSATAEDLPTASFAGVHDTFLHVVGSDSIIDRIRQCWASLFTDRAIAYRQRNGIDHRGVAMAVVVQRMVAARASGVMFTADPVSFDRSIVAIEACAGLGDALVSGRLNVDRHTVRHGEIVDTTIAGRDRETRSIAGSGAEPPSVGADERVHPVLSDAQVIGLAALGRRIEAHFGCPQDIEWCVADDEFNVVQSRPITTLFPIPAARDDANHVYISVGHNQMMTDAMKPLGLSFWQMTTPAPMCEAGGRLFVDVTSRLAAEASRADFLDLMGKTDPLLRDALQTIVDRGDFIPPAPDGTPGPPPAVGPTVLLDPDPAIVTDLIDESMASIATCRHEIQARSGGELIEFIVSDMQELRRVLFDQRSRQVYMTAMEATWWLNEHLLEWLGEKNVADVLTQSVPHNVTSEMGLALLDVADVIRPHPHVVAFLRDVDDDAFLDELNRIDGGSKARAAIEGFLATYGMRCAGEIDITRTRWSERPTTLLPTILAHVEHMEHGEARRRLDQGRQEAAAKERDVLERLRALPDGHRKAAETKQMIDRVRTFMGYREFPKYAMVSRYFLYKAALLAEAEQLVAHNVLRERNDIDFLRFDELADVIRTHTIEAELIDQRRHEFRTYQPLTPPRVLTSDGEAIVGSYRRGDLPDGAVPGLGVSAGVVEGRARVVTELAAADVEPGDILVTAYTDPSWTPLFVTIAGLVTEVGSMMTHGSVIAREYGLPAVVGVPNATERIHDGQRIRVHGTDGYVVLLPPGGAEPK